MRTQSREKLKQRNRCLPAIRGHATHEYGEFVPDDYARNPKAAYGRLFKRAEWGAVPALRSDGRLTQPIMYVNTVSVFLEAEDGSLEQGLKGPEVVRMFQKEDMKEGMSDIRSNFIIDEDGLIYEGRGWDQKPAITKKDSPTKYMEYLEICFIGDFSTASFNHPVNFATAKLMEIGKQSRFLSRDALMLSPEGVIYERKREPKMSGYLPAN